MRQRSPAGRALWQTLAMWMLPTLLFLMTAGLLLTVQGLREVADSAYDRSLAGAIRAIDSRISTESGGIGIELPYPLFEAISNLVDNAIAASPQGSQIVLSAHLSGSSTVIEVRDFGPGLPADLLARIGSGQQFIAGKSSKPDGSGLGLAIVQQIIKSMGGTLSLVNHESGGLSAIITIPMSDSES